MALKLGKVLAGTRLMRGPLYLKGFRHERRKSKLQRQFRTMANAGCADIFYLDVPQQRRGLPHRTRDRSGLAGRYPRLRGEGAAAMKRGLAYWKWRKVQIRESIVDMMKAYRFADKKEKEFEKHFLRK